MPPKCTKGTRRNKKSGNCEPKVSKPEPKRCPKGTRRNKKSGNCEPKVSKPEPKEDTSKDKKK